MIQFVIGAIIGACAGFLVCALVIINQYDKERGGEENDDD